MGDELALHAVRATAIGDAALCGAGIITAPVWGSFDPGAPGACLACAALLLDTDDTEDAEPNLPP